MKRLTVILLSLLAVLSCEKVHQWPEGCQPVDPTVVDASVSVSCEIDLDIEKIITKGSAAPVYTDESAQKYLRRFLIDIYEEEQYGENIVFSTVLTQEVTDKSNLTFNAGLHTRKYKAVIWMDYILKEDNGDLYYLTLNGMSAIRTQPIASYRGCDDFKDAQTVVFPFDLTDQTEWFSHITIDIPLQRPLAKITFEATDFEEFARKEGCPEDKYEEFAKNYLIHFSYNGYLPTGFNVLTQKLNDSQTGYRFDSTPSWILNTPDARMGFDYVFVNGDQSSVTISLEVVSRKDGTVVNRADGIVVPTYRGKETVVRDKFFTKDYVPGIGINPEFDGEFNVYV